MIRALALVALAAAAPAAADPPSLTRETAKAMAPEELSRRVFGEVGAMLYALPIREPGPSPLRAHPLRRLDFLTRPRGSYRAGLCETDWVVVEMEPAPLALGPDPAVRPARFAVYGQYLIRDSALVLENRAPEEAERTKLDEACRSVDPRPATRVTAGTAFDVVAGVRFLAELISAAKAGDLPSPLDCFDDFGEAEPAPSCAARLALLDPARLYAVTSDPGCGGKEAGRLCRTMRVHGGFRTVVIAGEWHRGSPRPHRISVGPDLEELIAH